MREKEAFTVLRNDDNPCFVHKSTSPTGAAQSGAKFKFAADDCAACFLYACFSANLFDE